MKYEITHIQLFDWCHEIYTSDYECEKVYSYSANVIINDEFMVQVSGDDESSNFDGIPHADEQTWKSRKKQNAAYNLIDNKELESLLEENGFENNREYLSQNGEIMQPDHAPF